jgi:hypothetical protein
MPQGDRNMFTGPSDRTYPHLSIIVDGSHLAQFFLLLQQGVKIRRRVGCSVDVFLRQEIGVTPETIEKIQSIMLDGKPVDDIGSSLLQDGSTLALSAALPGLVGATLRRGGSYSSFRSVITYHETGKACALGEGWVCVKIFNLLMAEMGPDFLRTGVLLRSSDLFSFLMERKEDFRERCSATLDGKTLDIGMLDGSTELVGQDYVLLTVAISPVNA